MLCYTTEISGFILYPNICKSVLIYSNGNVRLKTHKDSGETKMICEVHPMLKNQRSMISM